MFSVFLVSSTLLHKWRDLTDCNFWMSAILKTGQPCSISKLLKIALETQAPKL